MRGFGGRATSIGMGPIRRHEPSRSVMCEKKEMNVADSSGVRCHQS